MANGEKLNKYLKLLSWVVPGAAFTVAAISSVINSEFILRRAILGSLILAGLWIVLYLFFKFQKIKPDENSRIVFPGKQVNLFFIGAIVALWIPLLFVPLKAQKVEIILDISPRMWEEFDPPGTTKFDAARSAVLDVLGYLEGQNMQVALRLVESNRDGQCVIEPDSSLAVNFTKDFDQIRDYLDTIQPASFELAPVVTTISYTIDHYLDERIFDQKFYMYSFIGGDDTCGEKLGVFLTSPKVVDNSVTSEIFLIVLLGMDEDTTLRNLPYAKLDYARNAAQVEEIVDTNNQLIDVPTPTPTLSPTLSPSPSPFPANPGNAIVPPIGNNDEQEATLKTDLPLISNSAVPNPPMPGPTNVPPTAVPTFTDTRIPTFTKSITPTATRTATPIPSTATYAAVPVSITNLQENQVLNCSQGSACVYYLNVQWISDVQAQSQGKKLSIWVRPMPSLPDGSCQEYWPQNPPVYNGDGTWSIQTFVGNGSEPNGTKFTIYALVTNETYTNQDVRGYLPSSIDNDYVNVKRGSGNPPPPSCE